ncbi:MAG: hypothetical protein ACE5DI_00345 [Candidatus Micrarchaeia archaeon]
MNFNMFNQYVFRILASARPLDSVSALSKRIGLSYAWTYKWVGELAKIGVFSRKSGKRITLNPKNRFYKTALSFFASVAKGNVGLHYEALKYAGLKYTFTELDAVFIWTKGGYNIERSKSHYPIFIKVKQDDLNKWKKYFSKTGLRSYSDSNHSGVFYVLRPKNDFEVVSVEDAPTIPLKNAVAFMKKYKYNFLPALEMVSRMHRLGLKARYAVEPHNA